MAKITFRQFLAGIGDALPKMAQTLYQHNLRVADEKFRQEQLALEERRVTAQEGVFGEQVKMSEFQRTKVLEQELRMGELEIEMKGLLNELQTKQNTNYDPEFAKRMEKLQSDIDVQSQQIASLIAGDLNAEEKLALQRQQVRNELQNANLSVIGMANNMLKPEGRKVFEENYNRAVEADPNGVADLSQVLADTMLQNEGTNVFSSTEMAWMQTTMNTVADIYKGYVQNAMFETSRLKEAALFGTIDGESVTRSIRNDARETLTGTKKPTPNEIDAGGTNYLNLRVQGFSYDNMANQLGQFGLRIGGAPELTRTTLPIDLKTDLPTDDISTGKKPQDGRKSLGTSVITGKEVFAPADPTADPIRFKPYLSIRELNAGTTP